MGPLRPHVHVHVPSPPDMTILQELHHQWGANCLAGFDRYACGPEKYHRTKAVQTLGQSRMKDVYEKAMTEYITNKQRVEVKQQRKLHSLQILPSRRSDKKQKDRLKQRRQRKRTRKSSEDTSTVVNLPGEDLTKGENILLSK